VAWKNLIVEQGPVTLLKVNRPDQRNAIDFATMDELEVVLSMLETDESLQVLVLTGGGDTFVSGGDLKDFQILVTAADGQRMARRMGSILTRLSHLPVPVIAALNGPAVGGGTEVALACDLRVAAANAYFSFRQVTMGIMTAW
jgi:enoyl-CoA hydratase